MDRGNEFHEINFNFRKTESVVLLPTQDISKFLIGSKRPILRTENVENKMNQILLDR